MREYEKKQMMIKLSVVMPVLNGMPYFSKALKSVQKQTLSDIEILVVDAGSTDGTIEFVNTVTETDERVRLLSSDIKSMGRQYNIGIDNASGEYIGFCESDDYLSPDMLQRLYETACEKDYPDAVTMDFDMFVDDVGKEFSIHYGILPNNRKDLYGESINVDDCSDIFYRDVNMWDGIYKKNFLKGNNVRLNETPGAAFQDTGFVEQVHVFAKNQIYINGTGYHYRRDNLAASTFKKTAIFMIWELEYMLKRLSESDVLREKYTQHVMNRMFGYITFVCGNERIEGHDDRVNAALDNLRNELKAYLDLISQGLRRMLLLSEILYAFLYEPDTFYRMIELGATVRVNQIKTFSDALNMTDNLVVFGAGEIGQSYYTLTHCNGFKGRSIFCDNNSSLWGEKVMGLDVISVNEAITLYRDGLFLLPRNGFYAAMEKQLLGSDIRRNQIFSLAGISPHSSMEIKLEMKFH